MRALLTGLLLALAPLAVLTACPGPGTVVQGRTVAFDRTGKTVTIIRDTGTNPDRPRYDGLPPETFQLPTNPREMGPEPTAGRLLDLDPEAGALVVYNPATRRLDRLRPRIVEKQTGIAPNDPQVRDKRFPRVDHDSGIVTIYCPRRALVLSFLPPDAYRQLMPEDWGLGDVVRLYTKEPGKALRLMNVTKTDIFKK